MPLDPKIPIIDLQNFKNHSRMDVQDTHFNGKKSDGRKLWISFHHDQATHSKVFHLSKAEIVKIQERHYFRETAFKENKPIGFAFKKIDDLFLKNLGHEAAISFYAHSSSDENWPDFLLLNNEHKKLWTDSAPKNASL